MWWLVAWELGWWARRRLLRSSTFAKAQARARELGRPLVVIGAPDGGPTSGYGCGDVTIDLGGSACPHTLVLDVTKRLPFAASSVVVFESCVLEYVADPNAAACELLRISGGELFAVRVEPWTATAYVYPGARQVIPAHLTCKVTQ